MAFDRYDEWGSELRHLRRSVMLPLLSTVLAFTKSLDAGGIAFITKPLCLEALLACEGGFRGITWIHPEAREDVTSVASADEFLTLAVTLSRRNDEQVASTHTGQKHARHRALDRACRGERPAAPGVCRADDGHGFDRNSAGREHSYGLLGMNERARLIGGARSINSVPGAGTTVSIYIPLVGGLKK